MVFGAHLGGAYLFAAFFRALRCAIVRAAMEVAAFRLLYDNIHDFKTTAVHIESEIMRHGLNSDTDEEVPGMKGRRHRDMWMSMKTASHFNLGIALELMLKLILRLNRINPADVVQGKQGHFLTKLQDAIPQKYRDQLESKFQDSRGVILNGYELIAFIHTSSSASPQRPMDRDISSLRGLFEYFDEDMKWWQKRYSWELIDKGEWRHYLSDISVLVELINRVMRGIVPPLSAREPVSVLD